MPDAPSPAAGSLSARAEEILRRADAQLGARRAPATAAADAPEPDAPQAAADSAPQRPASAADLGQLLDTVQAGIAAARAHLVTLSASLERIAQELPRVASAEQRELASRPAAAAGQRPDRG